MKNWEKKKLGDVCGFVRGPFGGSLKKNIFKADGYAVYEQQHAIYDQFEDIRYFIDENKFNEMRRFELKSGDLIMSCSGTMGKIAIVPENIKKARNTAIILGMIEFLCCMASFFLYEIRRSKIIISFLIANILMTCFGFY
jgi:hypothetical protein